MFSKIKSSSILTKKRFAIFNARKVEGSKLFLSIKDIVCLEHLILFAKSS